MTAFKPRTSGIGSDHSTNWATQPLPIKIFSNDSYIFNIVLERSAMEHFSSWPTTKVLHG